MSKKYLKNAGSEESEALLHAPFLSSCLLEASSDTTFSTRSWRLYGTLGDGGAPGAKARHSAAPAPRGCAAVLRDARLSPAGSHGGAAVWWGGVPARMVSREECFHPRPSVSSVVPSVHHPRNFAEVSSCCTGKPIWGHVEKSHYRRHAEAQRRQGRHLHIIFPAPPRLCVTPLFQHALSSQANSSCCTGKLIWDRAPPDLSSLAN